MWLALLHEVGDYVKFVLYLFTGLIFAYGLADAVLKVASARFAATVALAASEWYKARMQFLKDVEKTVVDPGVTRH